MGKKYKYKIGDWVEFKTYLKVRSSDGKRCAHEVGLAKSRKGQICGAIVRHLGDIKNYHWDDHSPIDQNYLVIRKAVILYQVRDGMINIPYEVREEDLQQVFAPDVKHPKMRLPWRKVRISSWTKQQLSSKANAQQRDSKGRFIRLHLKVVNQ